MTFLTILRVTEILRSFKLVLEENTGKEIPESLRLEFSEKFSVNSFALLVSLLSGGTVQPENTYSLFPYPQGQRSGLRKPKKNKHQH